MAKVRERTAKADTLECYNCGERYSPFERKDVLRADNLPEEYVVEGKDALWEAVQPYILRSQVWCPGCEVIRYDDYCIYEEGQAVYECAACEAWWDSFDEAQGCCG